MTSQLCDFLIFGLFKDYYINTPLAAISYRVIRVVILNRIFGKINNIIIIMRENQCDYHTGKDVRMLVQYSTEPHPKEGRSTKHR